MDIIRYTRIWNNYLAPNPDFNYLMGYKGKTWYNQETMDMFLSSYYKYTTNQVVNTSLALSIYKVFNRFLHDDWTDASNAQNLISKIAIIVALDSFLDYIRNNGMYFEDSDHQEIKVKQGALSPGGLWGRPEALAMINLNGCWTGIVLADLNACTTLLDAKIYIFMGKVESEPFLLTDISSWKQAIEKVYNIWHTT